MSKAYPFLLMIIILSFSCADDNDVKNSQRDKTSLSDCSGNADASEREACYDKFFSWGGSLINGRDAESTDKMVIKEATNLDLFCEDLLRINNAALTDRLFMAAIISKAPCACDYAKMKSKEGGEKGETYKNLYLSRLKCGGSLEEPSKTIP